MQFWATGFIAAEKFSSPGCSSPSAWQEGRNFPEENDLCNTLKNK
jgi:hypothetical protein